MHLRVGNWKVEVTSDAWPIHVLLTRATGGGNVEAIGRFDHRELRDLEYAVNRAIHAAREALPLSCKHEMD